MRLKGLFACAAAAWVTLAFASAMDAQGPVVVRAGMTETQVVSLLGEPMLVRSAGEWRYLFYRNGCRSRCASDDVVFIRGCRVAGAFFRAPGRSWDGTPLRQSLVAAQPPCTAAADAVQPTQPTQPAEPTLQYAAVAPHPAPAGADAAAAPLTPPPAVAADTPAPPPAPAPSATAAGDARQMLALPRLVVRDVVHPGPAGTLSTPSPFGAVWREGFLGVGWQSRTRYTQSADAGAVVGFGVGRRDLAALEVALTSYSTIRAAPGETGGISVKVHRAFGPYTAVAAGVENAVLWGTFDASPSPYAVAGRVFPLSRDPLGPLSALMVTAGVGGGRFRTETDAAEGNETVNAFGSAALRVARPVSLIANLTGQDLNLGASVKPLDRLPLFITPGVADVTGTAGDGARFILSVGYGIHFGQPTIGERIP